MPKLFLSFFPIIYLFYKSTANLRCFIVKHSRIGANLCLTYPHFCNASAFFLCKIVVILNIIPIFAVCYYNTVATIIIFKLNFATMATRKKFFNTKREAIKARESYDPTHTYGLGVYKMPKGSRHPGKFAVCSYIEYLNTY